MALVKITTTRLMLLNVEKLFSVYVVYTLFVQSVWRWISWHHNAWHMEFCHSLIAMTVPAQHRLLDITM